MKMGAVFIFVIIYLHFLCFKGQTQHVRPRCGFPGLPFRGNITPYKDEYDINERILYKCQDGYDLEGRSYNDCNGNAIWDIHRPPLCRQNFAYRCKTSDSARDTTFPSDSAIDGNPTTCTDIKDGTDGSRWWTVYFQRRVNVSEVKVFARSGNRHYNLTLSIGVDAKQIYQCNKIVFTEKTSGENLNRTVRCEGQGFFLLIEDGRPYWMRTLNLCEVAVYSEIDLTCGKPDRNPNCLTTDDSIPNVQRVNYYPRPGYSIAKGEVIRTCSQGKWFPPISPQCEKIAGYIPDQVRPTGVNNSTGNFIVGVAIGVTAASVSTIIVIVVVIVVMRKYYNRGNNQSSTVSDGDGIFLRVNPSSVSSADSPTIQPTYSRPWDDPSLHMYEYIYSDSLPRLPPQTSLERQKTDGELVNFDKAGYLAHRSSTNKRPWTNSKDRNTSTRRSLLETPVPPQRDMTISSNTSTLPQGRISCYNELEVDAYGYAEPEDSCHV